MNEEDIMLEACIEMRFKAKVEDNRVVVTVNMCINAIQAFKHLADESRKCFRKRHTYHYISRRRKHSMFETNYRSGLGKVVRCQYYFDTTP